MTEHKKASAPAATRYARKGGKAGQPATKTILARILRAVNLTMISFIGLGAGVAIWCPVAYRTRGYWAMGGEIFLIVGTAWLICKAYLMLEEALRDA